MNPTDLVARYMSAWNQTDADARREVLDASWDADASYCDPTAQVDGRAAFVEHIGAFHRQFPGARFEVTSEVDAHHRHLRFEWRMVLADGKVFLEGVDFAELAPGGSMLKQVVGFFGQAQPRS
jgi:hypothetical protein